MISKKSEFSFTEDQKAELRSLLGKIENVKRIDKLLMILEKIVCPNYYCIKDSQAIGIKNLREVKMASKALEVLRKIKFNGAQFDGDNISDSDYELAIENAIDAIVKRHGYPLSRIQRSKSDRVNSTSKKSGRPRKDIGQREYILDWGIHVFRKWVDSNRKCTR